MSDQKTHTEIWKDIPRYEKLYMVSNLGNVKTLKYKGRNIVKQLKKGIGRGGYFKVVLSKNKKIKTYQIHQLVAMAFLNHTPCGHKIVVDHINNINTDNRVENLQLTSPRKNSTKDRINRTSKYTGVSKDKSSFRSKIVFKGKLIHLGRFKSEEEASKYYQNALIAIEKGDEIIGQTNIQNN